jgi:hypothetical protein
MLAGEVVNIVGLIDPAPLDADAPPFRLAMPEPSVITILSVLAQHGAHILPAIVSHQANSLAPAGVNFT